jgi:Carboxypeptidase regulatory-like domain
MKPGSSRGVMRSDHMPVPSSSRRRALIAIGLAAIAGLAWWGARGHGPRGPAGGSGAAAAGSGDRDLPGLPTVRRFVDGHWVTSPLRVGPRGFRAPHGLLRVTGTVRNLGDQSPAAGVEVVFADKAGEASTMADADGHYQIDLPAGAYHAFARGDGVIAVGWPGFERLPGAPQVDDAGMPVERAAPLISVLRDEDGVDLRVQRAGVIEGRVVDVDGHPIAHAVVRASGRGMRPVLGTDVAETGSDGAFRLEVPTGGYALDATHPDFAGLDDGRRWIDVLGGAPAHVDLTMIGGCIVRGRVVGADGQAAGDGAVELAQGGNDFTPAGKILPDGTFQWSTVAEGDVQIRAWPWKSPPSRPQTFTCREGARYDAVFQLPDQSPSLDGTIATTIGDPMPGAFIDVFALSSGGMNQQERADATGHWAVFALPPGDYLVTATVDGQGAVQQKVSVPGHGVDLTLGGTGALSGTVAGLSDGEMDLVVGACKNDAGVNLPGATHRLVPVRGGSFHLDGLAACATTISAQAAGRRQQMDITIEANRDTVTHFDFSARSQTAVLDDDQAGDAGQPPDVDIDDVPDVDDGPDPQTGDEPRRPSDMDPDYLARVGPM